MAIGDIRNILIIQTAYIGDVVLTEPLISRAAEKYPHASIDVVLIPQTAPLLETHPAVREVVVYDKRGDDRGWGGFRRLARRLRARAYDLALIPHRSLRSAMLAAIARVQNRVGFTTSAGAWLFHRRVPYVKSHEVLRNLRLLDADPQYRDPVIYLTEEDRRTAAQILAAKNSLRVALAPGSVWATKRWPLENFEALGHLLIQNFGAEVVLIGGPADRQLGESLQKRLGSSCRNLIGELTLRQSVAVLARMDALVSNDSAPTHLGVAAGCRVVTIFGSTVPEFGFAPYGSRHRVVEPSEELDCRPCGIHGRKKCPAGHFECMHSISPALVYRQVETLLKEAEVAAGS